MKETALLMACLEAFANMTDKLVTAMREEGKESRAHMLALVEAGKDSALEGATKASQCHTTANNQRILSKD